MLPEGRAASIKRADAERKKKKTVAVFSPSEISPRIADALQHSATPDDEPEAPDAQNAGEILESRELNRPGAIDAPDFNRFGGFGSPIAARY